MPHDHNDTAHNRAATVRALQAAAAEDGACPTCLVTAALYLSAGTAQDNPNIIHEGKQLDRAAFVKLASEIWKYLETLDDTDDDNARKRPLDLTALASGDLSN